MFGQSVFIGGQSFAAPFSRTGMDIGMSGSSYMPENEDIGDNQPEYGGKFPSLLGYCGNNLVH